MKSKLFWSCLMLLSLTLPVSAQDAPQKDKKVQTFAVSRDFDLPAAQIWAIVGEDYGAIAKSHPKIMSSTYINGTLMAGEGAERICNFNEKGTKFVKEKITDYNPEDMTFENIIYQAGKFPVDPEYARAIYKVEDLGNGKSRITFDMQFRTKPAIMGGMAKGQFKKIISNYFIAIEHHARTGEAVTKVNFKDIRKKYDS